MSMQHPTGVSADPHCWRDPFVWLGLQGETILIKYLSIIKQGVVTFLLDIGITACFLVGFYSFLILSSQMAHRSSTGSLYSGEFYPRRRQLLQM